MLRIHPTVERLLIAIFLIAIVVPLLGMTFVRNEHAPTENRTLATWPELSWDAASLRAYPDRITRYFEDHFALRPQLVRWQAELRLKALGVSPSEAVIKGRDGWLFYADDGAMKDYTEAPPFTEEDLEVWRNTLQDTSDYLRARGITYLFVISPDKHLVYPEYMPPEIRRAHISRIGQLVTHLREHSTVKVLDLRPALLRAKQHERIYHLTDTHWNDRGAFVGYEQILDALAEDVPGLRRASRAQFEARAVASQGLDLAGMMGLTSALTEDDLVLEPREPRTARIIEPAEPNRRLMHPRIVTESEARGPRAVIFMDSFGAALVPFLSEDFSRAVYLWQSNVDLDIVREERPRVVIHEWVGRRLSTVLPYNPVPQHVRTVSGQP
jgi:hypothetical protein